MADCTCDPKYLLRASEFSLSDRLFEEYSDYLFKYICSNPFPEGRQREEMDMQRTHNSHAKKLIWC